MEEMDCSNNLEEIQKPRSPTTIFMTSRLTFAPSYSTSYAYNSTSAASNLYEDADESSDEEGVEKLPFLSAVELKVYETMIENYKSFGTLQRDDVTSMKYMFGPIFLQMIELIDEDNISIMRSPSGKVLVQVYGKSSDVHYISPAKCICQCIGYQRGKKDYCKHILAAHFLLAIADEEEYEEVPDLKINELFNQYVKNARKK